MDPYISYLALQVENLHKDSKKIPEIQMLLHIGGVIVTGYVIPAATFAERSKKILEPLSELMEATREDVAIAGGISLAEINSELPKFLHLRNAEIRVPGADTGEPEGDSTTFWRGQIAHIDAFFLNQGMW